MRYKKEFFTQEEIKAVINISEKICEFVGISVDDLLSKSRKSNLVKARSMIVHYQYHNILLSKYNYKRSYALSCWYLDKDHTTGLHNLENCENSYRFDKQFRYHYDLICFLIRNPHQVTGKISLDKRWKEIRYDLSVSDRDKFAQLPPEVKETIEEYLNKQYSYGYVASRAEVTLEFVEYFVKATKFKTKTRSVGEQIRVDNFTSQPRLIVGR